MTQEQIVATKVIAEKDGWIFKRNGKTAELRDASGELLVGDHCWQENENCRIHKYRTSLDALVPVVKKVREELWNINGMGDIYQLGFDMAIGGAILDVDTIFQIVTTAIQFINDKKGEI